MLQLMLHAHRRIAIPPETRFVVRAYFHRHEFGDLREPANRRALAQSIVQPKATRFRDLGLDAREITEQIVAGPPTVGSAVGIVLRAYADRFGKPRWGDKRPGYHLYVPVLRRMFPDAQFVSLVRDGRDCVASLKRMPWWRRSTYESVQSWMLSVRNARRWARDLPADAFHELRYEELVADPDRQLRALCDFLGEEYDPAMATPSEVAAFAVPDRKTWHTRTHQEVSTGSVGNWRTRLEPWEIELCEAVMGDELRRQGYELTGAARPSAGHRLRYAKAVLAPRRRRWVEKLGRDRIELALRRESVAAQLPARTPTGS